MSGQVGRSGLPSHGGGETLTGTWAQTGGRGAPARCGGAGFAGRLASGPLTCCRCVRSSSVVCQPHVPGPPVSARWLWWQVRGAAASTEPGQAVWGNRGAAWRSGVCPWLQSVSPGGLPHKNSDAEGTTKAGQQSQQEGGNRGSRAGSWGSNAPQLGMLLRWACPQPEPQSMTLAPHQRPLEAPPLPDAQGAARPRLWCWAPCGPASSRWPRH